MKSWFQPTEFKKILFSCFLTASLLLFSNNPAAGQGIEIDAVVASIDGKPITLSELNQKLGLSSQLTLREASTSSQAKKLLELLILHKLLDTEASAQGISVSTAEVDEYLKSVAQQNKLSIDQLEQAVTAQHSSWKNYREQIYYEILKSKLASNFVRDQVAVSEEEINHHLEARPELLKAGSKVKIRQIVLSPSQYTPERASAIFAEIKSLLAAGETFGKLAAIYSNGAEAKEGGKLGVLLESDLNPVIFEAIANLEPGEISRIVQTQLGWHIFQLENRFGEDRPSEQEIREEIKGLLQQQKYETKLTAYLTEQLPKNHVVERKL